MARERSSLILVALVLFLLQGACRSEDGRAAAGDPGAAAPAPVQATGGASAVDVPAPIAVLRDLLADAGLAPRRIVRLASRQELPECPSAELRYRLYVGDQGAFFNASHYRTAADAQLCRNDFQAMARKGGASAWQRLEQDVYVHGSWLILFPPDMPTRDVRERILRAIGQAPTP